VVPVVPAPGGVLGQIAVGKQFLAAGLSAASGDSSVFQIEGVDITHGSFSANRGNIFTMENAPFVDGQGINSTVAIGRIVNATGIRGGAPWVSGGIDSGIHTVFGTPTPAAQIPATGTFTYNFIATTPPTYSNGSTAPGTLTGSAVVAFASLKVGVAMTATMPNQVFTIQTVNGDRIPRIPGSRAENRHSSCLVGRAPQSVYC